MDKEQYTLRKLINGALLIPSVLLAVLASAFFDLNVLVTVLIAILLTAGLVLLIKNWSMLDRPISKNVYTIWNVVIIVFFVIAYYSLRNAM